MVGVNDFAFPNRGAARMTTTLGLCASSATKIRVGCSIKFESFKTWLDKLALTRSQSIGRQGEEAQHRWAREQQFGSDEDCINN